MTSSFSTSGAVPRIAIQGERGSNSHMAVLEMLGSEIQIVPRNVSAEVFRAVVERSVDGAVLPIENSLHGSVAEHYDLLLQHPVQIHRESLLRIRHNLIAAPGVKLENVRSVISHPVALSQCRRYLDEMNGVQVLPFYDTAGSVKHLMEQGLRDTAGVAPELAALEYGAEVLVTGIEDHSANFTRFHLLLHQDQNASDNAAWPSSGTDGQPNKLTAAFSVEHRPGTLVAALQRLADADVDLTKIESRPVPGSPWEYVFYVDFRFQGEGEAEKVLLALREVSLKVKELGRYPAAPSVAGA